MVFVKNIKTIGDMKCIEIIGGLTLIAGGLFYDLDVKIKEDGRLHVRVLYKIRKTRYRMRRHFDMDEIQDLTIKEFYFILVELTAKHGEKRN